MGIFLYWTNSLCKKQSFYYLPQIPSKHILVFDTTIICIKSAEMEAGNVASGTEDVIQMTECSMCSKKIAKSSLKKHVKVVHCRQRFMCSTCKKTFGDNGLLKDHIDFVHLKLKKYVCPVCDKPFESKRRAKVHHNHTHNKSKPFECNFCGKRFPQNQNLKLHFEGVHLGPFLQNLFNSYKKKL